MRQLLADIAGLPVVVTEAEEPVLLGSAILGAMAAGRFNTMTEAMSHMTRTQRIFKPAGGAISAIHKSRFKTFETLQKAAKC